MAEASNNKTMQVGVDIAIFYEALGLIGPTNKIGRVDAFQTVELLIDEPQKAKFAKYNPMAPSFIKVKTIYSKADDGQLKQFEGEGWINFKRLREFKEHDLEVVQPAALTTMIMNVAQGMQVNGAFLMTTAALASGFANKRIGEGDDQRIGPFAISKQEWKTYVDGDDTGGLIERDIEGPAHQCVYAAERTKDEFDVMKETLGDSPTFAQLRFASLPGVGGLGAAHIVKGSPKEGINIDVALKTFLSDTDKTKTQEQIETDLQEILKANEKLFLTDGKHDQPRQLSQILDDIAAEMDKAAQAAGGPNDLIAQFLKDNPWEVPDDSDGYIPKKIFDMIVASEVTSKGLYEKKYHRPTLPGLYSGVTIGIGYDIGQTKADRIRKDWSNLVSPLHLNEILKASGATGNSRATPHLRRLRGLNPTLSIPWDDAVQVFRSSTVPRFVAQIKKAIGPNADDLQSKHPDSFGALISLCFNRGTGYFNSSSPRAVEMMRIKRFINSGEYEKVPEQFTKMKRLWIGKGVDGLLKRRDEEGAMFLAGLQSSSNTTVA